LNEYVCVGFRSGGPGGKTFGEGGEREKWIVIGMVGTVALLGTLAYYEMGYKEIAWKEFVNKYAYIYLQLLNGI
jgi:AFG3 family protein